jgi:hypothetical protein
VKKLLVFAALASLLAGCGGGGGGAKTSVLPSTGGSSTNTPGTSGNAGIPISSPQGTARATATATVGASALLPAFGSRTSGRATAAATTRRRSLSSFRTPLSSGIASVIVNGTLYQSTASVAVVTNSQTLIPTANGVTVSMTFSNVVPANNDWIVFDFIAQASDGSQYDLGDLATMINITANGSNSVNLDTNSTLRFQAIVTALGSAISSYDLENNATLDGAIATYLTGHPQYVPDPNTGLFSPATQQLIANDLLATYGRTVTITTSGGTGSSALFSIAYDYTSTDENNLMVNACPFDEEAGCTGTSNNNLNRYTGFAGAGVTYPYFIYGVPGAVCYDVSATDPTQPITTAGLCSQGPAIPVHTPGSGASSAYPNIVTAALIIAGGTTSLTVPVYGGHIIVGAHDRAAKNGLITLPPYGGTANIAGEAPGSFSKNVAMSSTALTVSAVDAQTQAMDASGQGWNTQGLFGGSDAGPNSSIYAYNQPFSNTYEGTLSTSPYTPFPTNILTFPATVPLFYSVYSNSNGPITGTFAYSLPELYGGYTYSLAIETSGSSTWTPGFAGPVSAVFNSSTGGPTVTFSNVTFPAATTAEIALYATINNSATPLTPVFGYVLQPNYVTSGGGAKFYTFCPGATTDVGTCDFAQYASPPTTTTYSFSPPNSVPGTDPQFNGTSNPISLTLDTWNPFGIPNSQLDMCGVSGCTPLVGAGTINATSTFFDNGTNLSYYNWHGPGSDATSSVTVNGAGGYSVNWNASGGLTGSFSSTTPALFGPQSQIFVSTSSPGSTAWGMTIMDTSGHTYTGVRTNQAGANTPEFFFPTIVVPITSSNITFTYALPSGTTGTGTFTLFNL